MLLITTERHTTKSERVRVLDVHWDVEETARFESSRDLLVDTIPDQPKTGRGERAVLYVNPSTREVWYEVEARPLTPEEEIQDRLASIEERVARLETERK